MAQNLIEIRDVAKTYELGETTVHALRGISLDVTAGGMVALMGPSGSGKSTLLNLMGALDLPSQGTVIVKGTDIGEMTRDELADFRNATIGFIFQNFNLVPVLTTLENVILPAQLGRSNKVHSLQARGAELLERVGLKQQTHQSVNRLSGGQMQRVAIARALMNRPPIILADEPTANLDHDTAATVLAILRDACRDEDATVVIATHDHAVLDYCQRVVQVKDGQLQSDQKR